MLIEALTRLRHAFTELQEQLDERSGLAGEVDRLAEQEGFYRMEVIPLNLTWQDRIEHYRKATNFPRSLVTLDDGQVMGLWVMGNDYRVKSGYYGGYPATYLKRVRALFPDKERVLHLFSGKVDTEVFPGDTVDLTAALEPTFVDDAQSLLAVPLQDYDLVLADPPYSVEDAEHYGPTMVKRNKVMQALERVRPGTHVVWLDQVLPMYRSESWKVEARIGVVKSTNHRFRCVTIFRRR